MANGQTIVYSLHQTIGHLGIFVSGKVAKKEHREFVSCMEMIEVAPPGLYEAVITEVSDDVENRDLIEGKYLFRLEPRTLDDIRAFGVNSPEDEKRFAAVARISEINLGLYRAFAQPVVRAMASAQTAEAMRSLHPNRMRFAVFSDRNPFMAAVKPMAEAVRASRRSVSADNPWLQAQTSASTVITESLKRWGEIRDGMTELMFMSAYGSPLLQAMVGLGAPGDEGERRIDRALTREAAAAELKAGLDAKFEQGGLEEAALRAVIYVRKPGSGFDERAYAHSSSSGPSAGRTCGSITSASARS